MTTPSPRRPDRRLLLALAATFAGVAVLLAAGGGVRADVGGLRVSVRSPNAAIVLALVSLGAWLALAQRSRAVSRDLEDAWALVDRHVHGVVIAIALASGAIAAVWATASAAGSDASGYLSEASLLSSGRLLHPDSLASQLNIAIERGLTSPLGWRPSALAGYQAPTYPPGLPLLMAVPHIIGGAFAACLVVGVSAAIAVWATGATGIALAGGAAGVVAALSLAMSPAFLFQSVQPMSDVPVTAAWMLCWWFIAKPTGTDGPSKSLGASPSTSPRGAAWAGLACAAAALIRPNLAPLAIAPFLSLLLAPPHLRTVAPSHPRTSAPPPPRTIVRFGIPVALAGLCLAILQWHWYGSPLRTGYSTAGELFALGNVSANASRYAGWLLDTSPVMMLAAIGWLLTRRRPLATPLALFATLVVAAYLPYAVFDDWSYLRFLLPAMAVGSIFVGAVVAAGAARVPGPARVFVVFAVLLALAAHGLAEARSRDAFKLGDQQHRIVQMAAALSTRLAPGDVLVSGEQSGSMRYHTGHEIVRWDAMRAEEWDQVFATLSTHGHRAWIVLDAWEEPLFRAKFRAHPEAALDWPPAVDAGDTHRTRAWRMGDREKFMRVETVPTERAW